VLKKYGLPATVFVYTDFLGGGDALTWAQMQEMLASGLVDVQSHSKSHRNLIERLPGETRSATAPTSTPRCACRATCSSAACRR
jgi:peptidoglycan/xylan/chitin deacetylase (PgdA/CDA1 family)